MRNLSFILLLFASLSAAAQKLPNKQKISVWSPPDIKIDGKANEWNGDYQAYNHSAEVFYTISNNNTNLYLIIYAIQPKVVEKIIEGGISFRISKDDKKSSHQIEILYPNMPLPVCKAILVSAGKSLTGQTVVVNMNHPDKSVNLTKSLDSIARSNEEASMDQVNEQLSKNLKEIKLKGINVIDTIPGVNEKTPSFRTLPLHAHYYKIIKTANQDGINAMVQFDKKGCIVYELEVPLKYLTEAIGDKSKFNYTVLINGRGEDGRAGNSWSFNKPGVFPHIKDEEMEVPTDFSGEYTLAKAP